MMRTITTLVVAAFALLGVSASAFAEVQVSMQNGHVTIVAKDATLRQILTEWARVGQTKIVNVERIPGGPITIELRDVPEEQALRVLLRPISGFMTAPRTTPATGGASVFDRVIVLPTLASAAPPLSAAAPPTPVPTFFPPPGTTPEAADEQQPGGAAAPVSPLNRGPVFVFPQPVTSTPPAQTGAGQAPVQAAPATPPPAAPVTAPAQAFPGVQTTTSPGGVAVPGMIVPAPTQQGQPNQQPQ